jgi:DNA-directed RNA polymerase subunit RPC12/RpoP
MTRFRCIACAREGEFVYDAERHECPRCGSSDVVSTSPSTTGLSRERRLHRRPARLIWNRGVAAWQVLSVIGGSN